MFLSEGDYAYVTGLLDGTVQKSPLLEELTDWAKQEPGLDVYAYFCDYAETGRLILRICIWEWGEYEKSKLMHITGAKSGFKPKVQKKFQIKFAELARKYQIHREYWDGRSISVIYMTISDEIARRIISASSGEIVALTTMHEDIWKIELIFGSVHFFYVTDEQTQLHETDGLSNRLRQRCADIVKEQDKFGVFSQGVSCVFTSKQMLDEKYAGSMFYYTR